MLAKRRRVYLKDGQFIYGIGVKIMVKYLVRELPEGKGFKISVVGDKKKPKSFFKTKEPYFIEGNTLYSHGLRLYPYTQKRDRKWLAAINKAGLVQRLNLLSDICEQIKKASEQKTISISEIIDNAFRQMSLIDKGIKRSVIEYIE
jgi:hypothetical protein